MHNYVHMDTFTYTSMQHTHTLSWYKYNLWFLSPAPWKPVKVEGHPRTGQILEIFWKVTSFLHLLLFGEWPCMIENNHVRFQRNIMSGGEAAKVWNFKCHSKAFFYFILQLPEGENLCGTLNKIIIKYWKTPPGLHGSNTANSTIHHKNLNGSATHAIVRDLDRFSSYRFSVTLCNARGCGKSTMTHTATGDEKATAGRWEGR